LKSKMTLISHFIIVGMIVSWFVDLSGLLTLQFQGIRLGLHYIFEFPLLIIWMYKLRKYHIKWTIYAVSSVVLFWILTAPLHLKMGYSMYWIVNSALLFVTCILFGAMVGIVENRIRLLLSGSGRKNGIE